MQPIATAAPAVIPSPYRAPELPAHDLATEVLRNADALPDQPALVDASDGHALTYDELAAAARRTASALAARGFGPGDTLAIYSPNLP